ncbi:MAG TPA: hypothetical protein VHR86_06885, partial [Armatimonadota bacterium]|nr:hypothetical protein [Armatimonadota bacterium]
ERNAVALAREHCRLPVRCSGAAVAWYNDFTEGRRQTMLAKDKIHRLVEVLPEEKLHEAERFLESLLDDPVLVALANAPADDEEETEAERQAVAESWTAFEHGEGIPHEEMLRRTKAKAA